MANDHAVVWFKWDFSVNLLDWCFVGWGRGSEGWYQLGWRLRYLFHGQGLKSSIIGVISWANNPPTHHSSVSPLPLQDPTPVNDVQSDYCCSSHTCLVTCNHSYLKFNIPTRQRIQRNRWTTATQTNQTNTLLNKHGTVAWARWSPPTLPNETASTYGYYASRWSYRLRNVVNHRSESQASSI